MGNQVSTQCGRERRLHRQQWAQANAAIRTVTQLHDCYEEEISEGNPVVVVTSAVCFTERRKKIPLTLLEGLEKISASRAVILLENAEFRFINCWHNVLRRLGVDSQVRSTCDLQVHNDNNYSNAMEVCLDHWIHNDLNASWDSLIQAVSHYEPTTGEKLRTLLGLFSTDVEDRLKRCCGEEFVVRLSEMLTPNHFQLLAPYLLSEAGEAMINEREPDDNLKVLRMLQHWIDCWKEKATYEALVCVAKDALPHETRIFDFVESVFQGSLRSLSGQVEPDFDCIMNEEDKVAHKHAFRELRLHFARMFAHGAASMVGKKDIDFEKVKYFVFSLLINQQQIEGVGNMSQLMNFIASRISWFDHEIFESVIMEFGDGEQKQKLEAYKADLDKYLNQSILNMPKNISSKLQPAELRRLPKVYLKIPDNESEMPNLYGLDVKDIKKRLAEHMGLSDGECIKFVAYRRGCIELIFMVDQDPDHPLPNTTWDEERQEHKITGDILTLLPDSFCKRNRALTCSMAAPKQPKASIQINGHDQDKRLKEYSASV